MGRRVLDTLKTYPWLACETGGRLAGYAYASRHRARAAYNWSVEVSAYVHHEFRRRGIGRGLYASLFEILKAQGYCRAYAGITLPNPGSVGLHESMGFEPVGVFRSIGHKMGVWHDVGWWQRALQEGVANPDTPLTLDAVRNHAAWPRMLAVGTACLRTRG
jgi:phosphinothricin acetyltransferase